MPVTDITSSGPDADVSPSTDGRASDPVAVGYRAGVVGTGFMGGVHARAIRVAGCTLAGVATADPAKAREAASMWNAAEAFDDADALIASDSIDVVHICTPNHLHAPIALAALRAGKHVVCEKPLATSLADAEQITAAARDAGVVGTVPFVYRFHPMARQAREMVRAGALGPITLAHGSYLQDWLADASDDNWRVDPALGGPSRAFGDIGSHWCDLMEFVTGQRITALCAQAGTVNPQRGGDAARPVQTEDIVTMQFRTDAQLLGSVVVSQVSPGRKNRLYLEVTGPAATVAFDQERPEELWEGRREGSRLTMRDPGTLAPDAARFARLPAGHPQGYQDCFDAFVADTAEAVAGGTPDGLPTFDDGLRAARVADAVLTSVKERGWVEVPA